MSPKRFEEPVSRRDILGRFAIGSFFLSVGAAILGVLRLPKPGVFPESASRFKVGFADDFPQDTHRSIDKRQVRVFRDALGFYAISSVCSHLGCIVTEKGNAESFTCPCHGSEFDASGRVLSGPAPRGLAWLEMSLAADGSLMVDTAKSVSPGTRFNV
jgi:cytochrome b6-f complex iron-sulfur subunit